MNSPDLQVFPDPVRLGRAAAEKLVTAASQAIAARRVFTVAFSGGSGPMGMFQLLGSPMYASQVDWSRVEVYFVDERCVLPTDNESNYKLAHDLLLSKVPIPAENVNRMRGEIDPSDAAIEYGQLLKSRFGDRGLDLMYLGMGDDGHTASLFPHTPAIDETHHRCVAQYVEHSTTGKSWRITLTAPFINRSAEVVVLLMGQGKAAILKTVLKGPRNPHLLPIQMIQPASGKMTWMLDEAAATKL